MSTQAELENVDVNTTHSTYCDLYGMNCGIDDWNRSVCWILIFSYFLLNFTQFAYLDPFEYYQNNEVKTLSIHQHGCYADGLTEYNEPLVSRFKLNEFINRNKPIKVSRQLIVSGKFLDLPDNHDNSKIFSRIMYAPTVVLERIGDVIVRDLEQVVLPSTTTVKIQQYSGRLLETFDLLKTFPSVEWLFIIKTNFEHLNPAWIVKNINIRQPIQDDRLSRRAINNFFQNKSNINLEFRSCSEETLELCKDTFKTIESYDIAMELSQIRYFNRPRGLDNTIRPIA